MEQRSLQIDAEKPLTNEHLANERTLLAWIRTAIGVMAFGFVVVKFSLFIRQMAIITGTGNGISQQGLSGPIGILLVGAGAASLLFGTWRYHKTEQRLRKGDYVHDSRILYLFVIVLVIFSILILFYLIRST